MVNVREEKNSPDHAGTALVHTRKNQPSPDFYSQNIHIWNSGEQLLIGNDLI